MSLILFHFGQVARPFVNFQKLAECLGVSIKAVNIADFSSLSAAIAHFSREDENAFVLDVASLSTRCTWNPEDQLGPKRAVLVLATSADAESSGFLADITQGVIRNVVSRELAQSIFFPLSLAGLNEQLSTFTYPRTPDPALELTLTTTIGWDALMTLDGFGAFGRLERSNVFIWATPRILDVHQPVRAESEFELVSDEYIPAIIFLRTACKDRCWRNPHTMGGIVIDDPLLKENYGYIAFPPLLASARQHAYHVTLAYIPWNYWRNSAAQAQPFIQHSDCFSLCVHGCDHNNNEYGSTDYNQLLAKNRLAIERMNRLRARQGIDFEPVMVCPQEECSVAAWRAFADSPEILAMINTGCMPRDLPRPQLCGADLLTPAQDSFFGFPVFKRYYSGNFAPFAMALFLGKPAILVEHHEYFRNGPGGVERFAAQLRRINPSLRWLPLSQTVIETHWRKELSPECTAIRFFSRKFRFSHSAPAMHRYELQKRVGTEPSVSRVLVNGRDTPFETRMPFLTFQIVASRSEEFHIELEFTPVTVNPRRNFGWRYNAGVALRRAMCEFRDNVIVRHPRTLRLGRKLAGRLRLTAGSQRPQK